MIIPPAWSYRDEMKRYAELVIILVTAVALLVGASPQASAAVKMPVAPIWNACAVWASQDKIVRKYSGATLTCGKQKDYGYRHLVYRHKDQFQAAAAPFLTSRTWRDLTDFVLEWTPKDPDRATYAGGKWCYDRQFYLANSHGNQVLVQRFIVILNSKRQVITAYPSGNKRC